MANPRVLERFRKSKTDWSQSDFAEKLGMSISTYKRVVNEETPLTIQLIQQAAKLFKVDENELMQETMMVEDLDMQYEIQRKISVSIELDGTKETLEYWFTVLKKVNAAIA